MDSEFFTENKKHIKRVAPKLQKLAEHRLNKWNKFAWMVPTRGGKSYTVHHLCAWTLGKYPEDSIMRNSYSDKLAWAFSRQIKAIIQSPKYQTLFPHVKLRQKQSAVDDWALETSKTTAYFCAGVGGTINGKGCTRLAILDDGIKGLAEAYSDATLETTWGWKLSSHNRRMETGCAELMVGTRWRNTDPMGRTIEAQPDKWEVEIVPALDKNDKSFCEEIRTTEEYLEMRRIEDPVIWAAVSMQQPIEAMGLLYPPDELNYYTKESVEKFTNDKYSESWDGKIACCDTADEGQDWLASGIGNIKGEMVYLDENIVFTQEPIEITQPMVAQQLIDTNPDRMTVESNNGGKGFALVIKELIKGSCRTIVRWKHTSKNKETRMLMKAGYVKEYFWFLAPGEYEPGSPYDKFMRQFTSTLRMGKSKYDDAGDLVTMMAEQRERKGIQFA